MNIFDPFESVAATLAVVKLGGVRCPNPTRHSDVALISGGREHLPARKEGERV
ncbi:MAG: hypothetical protein HN757_13315 [Calditrichaeota bacterium]|nr:hypothetical protein [Calditrichota bacterium]